MATSARHVVGLHEPPRNTSGAAGDRAPCSLPLLSGCPCSASAAAVVVPCVCGQQQPLAAAPADVLAAGCSAASTVLLRQLLPPALFVVC